MLLSIRISYHLIFYCEDRFKALTTDVSAIPNLLAIYCIFLLFFVYFVSSNKCSPDATRYGFYVTSNEVKSIFSVIYCNKKIVFKNKITLIVQLVLN